MKDKSTSSEKIDSLIKSVVFAADNQTKISNQSQIRQLAASKDIFLASIQSLYEASGKGLYHNKTVPAINIRGLTYHVARSVFKAALKDKVGAFIFEIARSEIGYTKQRPAEYSACLLAAAVREGFEGPVFLQGDHFQITRSKYLSGPDVELKAMKELIREALDAGFYNIDIDASTIVDLDKKTLDEEQEKNYMVTAELTKYIRIIEPPGVTVSVGGEIGEVGKQNSTVGDLRTFMAGYLRTLGNNVKGISKISVQTGTTHGGVVLPDGSIAEVELDFKTLEELSKLARAEYGLAGAVQHGASTLPDDAFGIFPKIGTAEVHLATGFQNIIYDSPFFPKELLNMIYKSLSGKYAGERKQGETDEQFYYKTRKKGFGDFKEEMWSLPEDNLNGLGKALEDRFSLLFHRLNVTNTQGLVNKYVAKP